MHTILFDFGNVVAYFDHRQALPHIRPHCDLPDEAILAAVYDAKLEDAFEAGQLGGDEFIRRARAAIDFRGSDEQFCSAFVDIFTPNPDVCALIPPLKPRYRLVLASNTNELHAAHFQKSFADVLRHFDAIGLSYEAGARKPRPAFYAHCQSLTDAPSHECLFIDDLAANVEAARAFGWQAIQYTGHPELLRQLRQHGVEM